MSRGWYILQTFAGYDQKVQKALLSKIEDQELDPRIVLQVKVPMEEVVEVKGGQKRRRSNKILPGYLMLELDLPEAAWRDTCNKIRHVQGVRGFVGVKPSERPRPIPDDEARNILLMAGEIKGEKQPRIKQNYEIGETVRITDGPFATFNGSIDTLDAEKGKVSVNVQIFGRSTPVEVDITQIEKI